LGEAAKSLAFPPVRRNGVMCSWFFFRSEKLMFGFDSAANLPIAAGDPVLAHLQTGIYFGWATLGGKVFKAVLSIGYNPYFENKEKSLVRSIHPLQLWVALD
jgi:hypothetical protein